MADPRLSLAYDELQAEYAPAAIDNSTITYDQAQSGGSAGVGLAVTLSANGTVALCADGDPVYGRLALVEWDGKASVQVEGFMKLPGGTSATLTPGLRVVGALGASSAKGYIRAAAVPTGSYVQGTATDAAKSRGEIIDSSDTTNVWVRL